MANIPANSKEERKPLAKVYCNRKNCILTDEGQQAAFDFHALYLHHHKVQIYANHNNGEQYGHDFVSAVNKAN